MTHYGASLASDAYETHWFWIVERANPVFFNLGVGTTELTSFSGYPTFPSDHDMQGEGV